MVEKNQEARMLKTSISPSVVYITNDQSDPYVNGKLVLSISSMQVPLAEKEEQPAVVTGNGSPRITVFSMWKKPEADMEEEALCSEEEARNIRLTPCSGCGWLVDWQKTGLYWNVTPPSGWDPQEEFKITLAMENIITTVPQGMAYLYIRPMNIPGIPEGSCSLVTLDRRYPMRIRYFRAEPAYVRRGDNCQLSWDVVNGIRCSINGKAENLAGADDFEIERDTDFILTAQNLFGDIKQEKLTVKITNWKKTGEEAKSPFFAKEPVLKFNRRIFPWKDKLVAYEEGCVYVSEDSGGSWKVLWKTEDQEICSCDQAVPLLSKNSLILAGQEKAYCCILDSGNWEKKEDSDLGLKTACCSLVVGKRKIIFNIIDDDTLVIFMYNDSAGTWGMTGSIRFTTYWETLKKADRIDGTVCEGKIYLAVRNQVDQKIHLFVTEDCLTLHSCAEPFGPVRGWFRLATCKEMLLFISAQGPVAPLDATVKFPNLLPELQEDEGCEPWLGMDGNGGLAVLVPTEEKAGIYWQFTI